MKISSPLQSVAHGFHTRVLCHLKINATYLSRIAYLFTILKQKPIRGDFVIFLLEFERENNPQMKLTGADQYDECYSVHGLYLIP